MRKGTGWILTAVMALAGCGSGSGGGGNPPPVNQAPVAQADSARTRPGVAVEVAVLANDADPEGAALTAIPQASVTSATVTAQPNGRLRVTPDSGFAGTLEFTYTAQDSAGARSAPATVSVVVGITARAMLAGVAADGMPTRVFITGATPGDNAELLGPGLCGVGQFAAISLDMRTLIGVQCGATQTRRNLVVMSPLAVTLAPPVNLLTNVALAPGFAMSVDGSTVTVAERIGNPDDLSLPGTYELLRIDVATRSVIARLALPGIENIQGLRGHGGSSSVLIVSDGGNALPLPLPFPPPFPFPFPGGGDLHLASFDTGTVVRINAPGDGPPALELTVASGNGRYVIYPDGSGDLRGYDLTDPGVPIIFWSSLARGESVSSLTFAPAPSGNSMLLGTYDVVAQLHGLWELPLDDPAAARPLLRYTRQWTDLPAPMILGPDRVLLASDTAQIDHSEVREIRVSTGEVLATWTPAGGVPNLQGMQRLGATALLLDYAEPTAGLPRRRIGIVQGSSPGQVTLVAPDLDLAGALLGAADRDGNVFGLSTGIGAVLTPYLVDVNLPANPLPLADRLEPGEQGHTMMVFSPPDP